MRFEEVGLFLVNEGQIIKDNVIVGLYKKDGKLLIVTDKSGFYFLEDDQLTKWLINAEKRLMVLDFILQLNYPMGVMLWELFPMVYL